MLSSVAAGAAEVAAATAAPNEKPPVEKPMLGAAGVEELDVEPNEKPPDKAESVLGCEVPKENGAVEATDSAGFDAGADDPKLNNEAGAGADVLISVGFSGIVDEVGFTMPNETDLVESTFFSDRSGTISLELTVLLSLIPFTFSFLFEPNSFSMSSKCWS